MWKRIKDIIRAWLHALFDRAENPVTMADEYIRQLEAQYGEAKRATAMAMGQATRMEQKRDENRKQADDWERKAVNALERGDEELARSALERKRHFSAAASEYATQSETQNAQVKDFRNSISRLEQQINEARAKRDLIKAKTSRADSQEAATRALQNMQGSGELGDRLGAMEERIDDRLYKAEAMAKLEGDSLENKFRNLEQETSLESELAALKAKVNQS